MSSSETPIFWQAPASTTASLPAPCQRIDQLRSLGLMDMSGSTSGGINQASRIVLSDFSMDAFAVWSTTALYAGERSHYNVERFMRSDGGTQPASIFVNTDIARRIANDYPVVYFTTDGCVDASDIERFAAHTSRGFANQTALVCILIGPRDGYVKNANVSVFYPLLTHPRFLLLHYNAHDYRIIHASTQMRAVGKLELSDRVLQDNVSFGDLPLLSPKQFLQWSLEVRSKQVTAPAGYEWLNEPVNTAVNLVALVESTAAYSNDTWALLVQAFGDILLMAKTRNELQRVRKWIERARDQTYAQQRLLAEQESTSNTGLQTLDAEVDRLNARLMEDATINAASSDRAQICSELRMARSAAETARADFTRELKKGEQWGRCSDRLRDMDRWLQALQQLESSAYRASDLSSASLANLGNRAKRATDAKELEFSDRELDALDWTDAPNVECSVCMETAPACLLLREDSKLNADEVKEALEFNGTDFCMDFPLACGPRNLLFMSPDVVCRACAKYLHTRGRDLSGSRITALVPVVKLAKASYNSRYTYQALANGLAQRRELPHLHLLWFAILDAAQRKAWGHEADMQRLLQFVQTQLLDVAQARSNFRMDGQPCSLRQAITAMCSASALTDLLAQPLLAGDIIVRYGPLAESARLLRFTQVVYRSMLRRALHELHPSMHGTQAPARDTRFRFAILDALFECPCGIPIRGTERAVPFLPRRLIHSILLPDCDWNAILQTYPEFATIASHDQFKLFVIRLYRLSYAPLEKAAASLQLDRLNTDYTTPACFEAARTTIPREGLPLNPTVSVRGPTDIHARYMPPFVTAAGPSLLSCICGALFISENELNRSNAWEIIQQARDRHIREVYGNGLPPKHSTTMCNLHRLIVDFFSVTGAVVPDTVTRPLFIQVLNFMWRRGHTGKLGHIYSREVMSDLLSGLRSYISVVKLRPATQEHDMAASFMVGRLSKVAQSLVSFSPLAQVDVSDPMSRLQAELYRGYDAALVAARMPIAPSGYDTELMADFTDEEKQSVLRLYE